MNGWEKDNAYMDLTANYTRTFYKKKATAGTSGYIYQDAVTYDQYSYINDWGGVDTGYFTKTEAKAGTSGYIYQEGGKQRIQTRIHHWHTSRRTLTCVILHHM